MKIKLMECVMKISHYLYNAFIIENGRTKLAIDPGQNLWFLKLRSLIPKPEWENVTHVLVTHGDPDHYWQADRVAKISGAPLIMGKPMVRASESKTQILNPRRGGLSFIDYDGEVHALDAGGIVSLDDVRIEGIKTVHGPIEYKVLGITKRECPGPGERVGLGAIGFKVQIEDQTVVNLGDSLLQEGWSGLNPDVLMLPIGGLGENTWTMDVNDALEAVRLVSPGMVIPCHYNASFIWIKNAAPADDQLFKSEVKKMGIECAIMNYGDSVEIRAH
jgi:L-ascorbate metabolism protein UlaG (beta-lactamase superfamily)